MKAVIMAGGKGTRLRPLTCNLPKPMVPILSKPVMEYTIMLLKKHNITEIAVTVQYLPEEIINYFGDGKEWGVGLHYFEETQPLGTAGSVKNCEKFLDEPFIVISGDGITDIDLTKGINFHQEKQALATIVLTKADNPLEFGVVIVDDDGKIARFLEKPSWSQVFSDLVNTGIYILQPEVLKFCPENSFFDFSKNLFPILLEQKLPLYGCGLAGYWSDIGNIQQYCQTQFDILLGKTTISVAGREIKPSVWIQEGVEIAPEATIIPPVFIGANTILEKGVTVGELSIIGKNNIFRNGTTVKKTVCLNNGYFSYNVELRGCVVGNKVRLGEKVRIFEGATIGDNSVIGNKCTVNPDVKLWPHKQVEEGVRVTQSLIWAEKQNRFLFGLSGITGLMGVELTPLHAIRVAGAFASTLPSKAAIVLGSSPNKFAGVLKDSIRSSLLASGIYVTDIGIVSLPVMRSATRNYESDGGIYVGANSQDNGLIIMLDKEGINIPVSLERKIENSLAGEDFPLTMVGQIGELNYCDQASSRYLEALLKKVEHNAIREKEYKLTVVSDEGYVTLLLNQLAKELHIKLTVLPSDRRNEITDYMAKEQTNLGAMINSFGDKIKLYSDGGELVSREKLDAFQAKLSLWNKRDDKISVSIAASSLVEEVAEELGVHIGRTQIHPHQVMNANSRDWLTINCDALGFIVKTLEYMSLTNQTLSKIISAFPDMYQSQKEIPCPWHHKGLVMRRLMEELKRTSAELVDGIKFYHNDGWTLILPDAERPIITLTAEANSKDQVDRHLDYYENKIMELFQ
ncbi:MAG: NTP transferase domain-containing protein [Clostridia bacterium]|nr:NTP transferase domain-containing protein [Clostridia bacterium]